MRHDGRAMGAGMECALLLRYMAFVLPEDGSSKHVQGTPRSEHDQPEALGKLMASCPTVPG